MNSPTYLLLHGDQQEEPKKPRQLPPQDAPPAGSQPVFPARPVNLGQQQGEQKGVEICLKHESKNYPPKIIKFLKPMMSF